MGRYSGGLSPPKITTEVLDLGATGTCEVPSYSVVILNPQQAQNLERDRHSRAFNRPALPTAEALMRRSLIRKVNIRGNPDGPIWASSHNRGTTVRVCGSSCVRQSRMLPELCHQQQ